MLSTMEATKCAEAVDIMKDWSSFKNSLREGIQTARTLGMSDQEIQASAVRVGDYLNENICPGTSEEQVLKEMWDVSSADERKAEASILYKMITREESQCGISCAQPPDLMKDWSSFKKSLRTGIETGRKLGMSDSSIQEAAVRVGDFLNEKICPSNSEEQLLKDMWDVSTPEERKATASAIYKMILK